MAAAAIGRNGTPWKEHFWHLEQEGFNYSECIKALKKHPGHYFIPRNTSRRASRNLADQTAIKVYLTHATLVVVPSNLVKQWEQEIKKHTTGLKVLVMAQAKEKLPATKDLIEYDLILFSKQRFDMEASASIAKMGRQQETTLRDCNCPNISDTKGKNCTCFKDEGVYQSPLKQIHFKRLITDEGHAFGKPISFITL